MLKTLFKKIKELIDDTNFPDDYSETSIDIFKEIRNILDDTEVLEIKLEYWGGKIIIPSRNYIAYWVDLEDHRDMYEKLRKTTKLVFDNEFDAAIKTRKQIK